MRPGIFEHTQDFHLKLLDAVAGEDGASDAVHAGPDILQREYGLGGQSGSERQECRDGKTIHITIVQGWGKGKLIYGGPRYAGENRKG